MNDFKDQKYLWLSIGFNTSIFFSLFSFIFCVLSSIVLSSTAKLPNLPANLVILGISFLLSILVSIIVKKQKKSYINVKLRFLYYASISYTFLHIIYYLLVVLTIKIKPSLFCLVALLGASIIFAIIQAYVPIKSYLFKAFIYFIIYFIPYYVTVYISKLVVGNKLFILFAIYLAIYSVIFSIFYILELVKRKFNNESKEYKQMFK